MDDGLSAAWRAHHGYLVDLAFRMLGDVGEAQDVVTEAFLRRGSATGVADERGWLTVVTSRLCLDTLRSARHRRERPQRADLADAAAPLGQSPAPDPADRVTLDERVRAALLVVLGRLGPAERVAFVLHDVFALPFDEIAAILGRTAPGCRQLAHRARRQIADAPAVPGATVAPAEHQRLTAAFIAACAGGDLDAMVAVLDPGVWGRVDFGPRSPITGQVNHGPALVGGTLVRYWRAATLVSCPLGGTPVVLAYVDRRLTAVITLTVRDGLIAAVEVIGDPSRIAGMLPA